MQLNWNKEIGKDVPTVQDEAFIAAAGTADVQWKTGYDPGIDPGITHL